MKTPKIIIVLYLIIQCSVMTSAQDEVVKGFEFSDHYGNKIILENFASYPSSLDSSFWKKELNGSFFGNDKNKMQEAHSYIISGVKVIKKGRTYDLRVMRKLEEGMTIQDAMRQSGWSNYRMKIMKKSSGEYKIISLLLVSGEI
jgi:hypothetical protein